LGNEATASRKIVRRPWNFGVKKIAALSQLRRRQNGIVAWRHYGHPRWSLGGLSFSYLSLTANDARPVATARIKYDIFLVKVGEDQKNAEA
jgi:hypothetical protein